MKMPHTKIDDRIKHIPYINLMFYALIIFICGTTYLVYLLCEQIAYNWPSLWKGMVFCYNVWLIIALISIAYNIKLLNKIALRILNN